MENKQEKKIVAETKRIYKMSGSVELKSATVSYRYKSRILILNRGRRYESEGFRKLCQAVNF